MYECRWRAHKPILTKLYMAKNTEIRSHLLSLFLIVKMPVLIMFQWKDCLVIYFPTSEIRLEEEDVLDGIDSFTLVKQWHMDIHFFPYSSCFCYSCSIKLRKYYFLDLFIIIKVIKVSFFWNKQFLNKLLLKYFYLVFMKTWI